MARPRVQSLVLVALISLVSACTTVPLPTERGSSGSDPTAGPPAQLGFVSQPSAAAAGQVLPAVQVAIEDSEGNTDTAATNSVTVTVGSNPSNATLSGTTSAVALHGMATFSTLNLSKAGTGYSLNAYAAGLKGATSVVFNVAAGAPVIVGFVVQPSAAAAGHAFSPAVQVSIQDAAGSTVTSATNSVSLSIGTNAAGGTLSGTTTVSAVNGIATFSSVGINNAGIGYTLVASATALSSGTSDAFAVVPTSFAAVNHTCAITTIGAAYCWGNNNNGSLGVGTFNGPTQCAEQGAVLPLYCSTIPVLVSGGLTFRSLSAGGSPCGITAAGAAYCWGFNNLGQLGNGTTSNDSVPVAVSGGLTFAMISTAGENACGVTTTGAGYCWGRNQSGIAGNGTTNSTASPVAVSGGLAFTAVSVGEDHTCGVATNGALYCWGDNTYGQLGNSTTTSSSIPVPVAGGLTFVAVSAGLGSSCGLTPEGAIYCWGDNTYGQLGNGSTLGSTSPAAVSGSLTYATVSVNVRSVCAVTTGNAAYCWGQNNYSELGNGMATDGPTALPAPVSGGLRFSAVNGNCGLATSGVAYCWGADVSGELGNGTTGYGSTTPVPVY